MDYALLNVVFVKLLAQVLRLLLLFESTFLLLTHPDYRLELIRAQKHFPPILLLLNILVNIVMSQNQVVDSDIPF